MRAGFGAQDFGVYRPRDRARRAADHLPVPGPPPTPGRPGRRPSCRARPCHSPAGPPPLQVSGPSASPGDRGAAGAAPRTRRRRPAGAAGPLPRWVGSGRAISTRRTVRALVGREAGLYVLSQVGDQDGLAQDQGSAAIPAASRRSERPLPDRRPRRGSPIVRGRHPWTQKFRTGKRGQATLSPGPILKSPSPHAEPRRDEVIVHE